MPQDELRKETEFFNYTIVHNEFIRCTKLKPSEKAVFTCLLSYANRETNTCFPSMSRLCKETNQSRHTVHSCIESLKERGVIKVEQIKTDKGEFKNNVYTIYNTKEVWNQLERGEKVKPTKVNSEQTQITELIKQLEQLGYEVRPKEKEPKSDTWQVTEMDSNNQNYNYSNNKLEKNQVHFETTLEDMNVSELEEFDETEFISDPREVNYKNETLRFLAESVDYKFSESEMQVLYDCIGRVIPNADARERYDYLLRKWHELQAEDEKKKLQNDGIRNYYTYIKKMIETDAN